MVMIVDLVGRHRLLISTPGSGRDGMMAGRHGAGRSSASTLRCGRRASHLPLHSFFFSGPCESV